ncbi:DEDD exonuclease domain-containing protein [Demequina muriae]|uniref:DEDD exonuclease domain-containing protein n=1 Tax=Demequina muriae TaxID=3051664 RepID=A0ABT8GJF4_9MICO|nr:DEDD exonuclease domain-containing protein [Demequina sp. EGI L300058]MDN4481562.1 DEDD exonuclease domain-containing protein [Demequina sp. EGI L300058]
MTVAVQGSLEEIGEPLSATTFVVVDLETTGGSPRDCEITEIGAVKTRGGEVVGEFQTLVDPGGPIPPYIVALTGITDAMVVAAPPIAQVLPSFLEFLGDAVLVAHNARFDVGFLKEACRRHGYAWPAPEIVDTVLLARRATTKEEAPNKKLVTLARVFGTRVTPNHRALEDARATSEVLHGMLERLAAFGITHREDLDSLRNPMPSALRRKATMADRVPAKPGVYTFCGPLGERLYVGTSRNLRARVKSYFTSSESRRGIRDMLALAVDVDTVVCPTQLEATILEVRMIDQWRPRYNRRSARPERTAWLRLTDERYPRLSAVKSAYGEPSWLGPMRSMADARLAASALEQAIGIRTCTTRLTIVPRADARACILKDLGACTAPCIRGEESGYDVTLLAARDALDRDVSPVVEAMRREVASRAERLEYERAGELRDALSALVDGAMRRDRLAALRACRLVAVRRVDEAWELASFSHGALAGSTRVESGVWDAADELRTRWDALEIDAALVEEQEIALRWLERPGTRLLYVDGEWSSPVTGAGRHRHWVDARRSDHDSRVGSERR